MLMGHVYNRTADRSALAILDAHTLDDVARIQLPHRVPAGFHGNWVPTPNRAALCADPPQAQFVIR